jgi:hypothetical protein
LPGISGIKTGSQWTYSLFDNGTILKEIFSMESDERKLIYIIVYRISVFLIGLYFTYLFETRDRFWWAVATFVFTGIALFSSQYSQGDKK